MKWHCVKKDGHCSGEPTNVQLNSQDWGSGSTCELDPETCGKYKSSQQIWDELPQEEKDRVSRPSYKETRTLAEKPKENSSKEKPKTKATKKPEAEIAQSTML